MDSIVRRGLCELEKHGGFHSTCKATRDGVSPCWMMRGVVGGIPIATAVQVRSTCHANGVPLGEAAGFGIVRPRLSACLVDNLNPFDKEPASVRRLPKESYS